MQHLLEEFDCINTALLHGCNLIEASAGTGKTYAISMLVLRFVVEQQLDIKKILVLTFTNAATEELKARIRKRLFDAREALFNQQSISDDNLKRWITGLEIEPQNIIKRINHALCEIDQAGIFTIHGFFQRLLSEYTLESGQSFDLELTGNIKDIKQTCTDDFWRQHIYFRPAWEVAILTADYPTPEQLQASVDFIAPDIKVLPDKEALEQKFIDLNKRLKTNKKSIISFFKTMQKALTEGKFKKVFTDKFNENSQCIIDWLDKKNTDLPDFSSINQLGLMNALNSNKFRTSQKNPLVCADQKTAYIQSLGIDTHAIEAIDVALTTIKLIFRRALLESLREGLEQRLEEINTLSFDHLISRVSSALRNQEGQLLCAEIRQKYFATLVDEFQDTDKKQWFIIQSLFHSSEQYLYLIGDPKQAIYKFRGADINSYFVAHQQANRYFTLSQNWRSHSRLVDGINALFKKNKAFYSENLDFYPAKSAITSKQGILTYKGKQLPPLVLWHLDKGEKDYWSAGRASVEIQQGVINEILHLLTAQFILRKEADWHDEKPVQAKDIAILVRTNTQAEAFKYALNTSGVTALINSKESVFGSAEAIDLYILLQAIAQPADHSLVKQAIALTGFNLDGQQLFQAINNEREYEAWLVRFHNYQQIWHNKGLMSMMRYLMTEETLQPYLPKAHGTERSITNLQHIIELVQQAVIEEHLGVNKMLAWLSRNISQADTNNTAENEQQLRLESDEDAVKIITMHSAKGLEFPIVFCPYLWQRGARLRQEKQLITCYNNEQMIADLGTDQFDFHRKIALEEELAENIRVFYVAVTRAQYRCYVNWADVRTKEKVNDSAMAYLLECAQGDFLAQQKCLKRFSIDHPEAFDYRLLALGQSLPECYQTQPSMRILTGKQRYRSLYTSWQMSSYTALSSLSFHESSVTTEVPEDKAREPLAGHIVATESNELPRGTCTGNVIHDLLENLSFRIIAENKDISTQRNQSCLRYGLTTKQPELLDQLLIHTVSTFLTTENGYFNLQQLDEQQCLKEMPFYLPVKLFDASQVNTILEDCSTYSPLSKKMISGYLTGFIDLICEYNGQYYIIDYKSNRLESYDQESLIQVMREHNYGLQYWIYSLVLHCYLQYRLPNYHYDKHFGGIKYLFVRGMNKDKENSGVYQTRPEFVRIQQLSAQLIPEIR